MSRYRCYRERRPSVTLVSPRTLTARSRRKRARMKALESSGTSSGRLHPNRAFQE